MHTHILIIGAGPAGLACAKALAENGVTPLVLERKEIIGPKVCAGGITWSGLISRVPEGFAEASFNRQYVQTPLQRVCIEEETPIIATVSRGKLGRMMAEAAQKAGARIRTGMIVRKIENNSATVQDRQSGEQRKITFDILVGADGSNSIVRRYLGLKSAKLGIGINYQITGKSEKMEWHLNNRIFRNGYAWIFPHTRSGTLSVGAYLPGRNLSPSQLKQSLKYWAAKQGFNLSGQKAEAEYINFDYQGWNFGKTFLAGDAAGLASGLTGEGIYPAIISGEQIAATILSPDIASMTMNRLVHRHSRHTTIVKISERSGMVNSMLAELVTLGLRSGIVKFNKLEMAV